MLWDVWQGQAFYRLLDYSRGRVPAAWSAFFPAVAGVWAQKDDDPGQQGPWGLEACGVQVQAGAFWGQDRLGVLWGPGLGEAGQAEDGGLEVGPLELDGWDDNYYCSYVSPQKAAACLSFAI